MTATPLPTIARDFSLKINTGTVAAPVWTSIGGITQISPQPSTTMSDDGDFDSAGRAQSSVVERGDAFNITLNYKEDPNSTPKGARDPGQQAVMDAAAAIGPAAKKEYQYATPNGWVYQFTANAEVAKPGGGKTDNASMTFTLTVDGDITETAPV